MNAYTYTYLVGLILCGWWSLLKNSVLLVFS